jgi:hypothetical protein
LGKINSREVNLPIFCCAGYTAAGADGENRYREEEDIIVPVIIIERTSEQ